MSKYNKLLLLFVFLIGTEIAVLGQKKSTTSSSKQDTVSATTYQVDYSSEKKKYEIAGIKVTGAPSYEEYVLIGFSGLAIGDNIEIPGDAITKCVKRFWKQGIFSDVKVKIDKINGKYIWLEIALKMRPRISSLEYYGLKKGEQEDIENKVTIARGGQMTPNIESKTKTIIKKFFAEKGYKNCEVRIIQEPDVDHSGYVKVTIAVNKKNKTRVNRIYITGNKALSSKIINRAMKKTNDNTTLITAFRTKKFVEKEYENDKKLIIEKYNEFGYRDAYIVSDSVVVSPNKPDKVNVYLTIHEGDKYYIRDIHWVGNTVYPYEILNATLNIKKGDVYNLKYLNDRLINDDDAVAKLYTDQGYLFFNVDPVETKTSNDSIDFEMRIFEGQPATINKINIVGNTRVYEHVVRRELYTKPGQLYSQSDIMRSLRELAQMGHFDQEKLVPDIQPHPEEGTVDITYNLETKSSDQIEFSLGWGSTGLVGSIGVKFTNFAIQNLFNKKAYRIVPQGEGQTFSVNARTNGVYYTSVSLSFLEPWLGGKRPNSLSASIYFANQTGYSKRFENQYNQLNEYYYNSYYGNYGSSYYNLQANEADPGKYLRTLGMGIGYGKRLNWPDDYFSFYTELSYQIYWLKEWPYLLISNGTFHNFSINLQLSRSSIDNPIYTRRGSQFVIGLKITPPYSLFSNKNYSNMTDNEKYRLIEYHKWKFSAKIFTPLSRDNKLVLMTRADFGYLGHFNKNLKSPFETYYMGGDGTTGYSSYSTDYVSMRGYTSGSLTPFDATMGRQNGYVYNKFTMELRYPVCLEQQATIWLLTFVEAGNCFLKLSDYNPFNLKRSAGVGVRVFLPMFGLLGVDWGWGFDKIDGDSSFGKSQFHFVLGQEL